MDHFKIEVSEVNEPARLSEIECLGLIEIGEVFVICENLHRKWRAMKVVAPRFQGTDDCEEFSVVDVIVSLSKRE